MFDYVKRICIALVLAVFIGALFIGVSTINAQGQEVKTIQLGKLSYTSETASSHIC
ncbi:hypothetical protein [Alkalicoccobacillus murimartini]|uniref:Uncharacterized membrane-anchored protein YhcB (DUF1043 family) n=1 Tax=Alkalicoccobacillus murimartini TaxID=171685 RepID=A0ABT9YDS0_9BACI|nr:hypothetical protein [Alkalicoccobacillus murimartini]MDQ0205869.1 uncharacterized membrane-anchored protein YhcB (DUF1043 family) [Alkalicoccobacillus murimartini]